MPDEDEQLVEYTIINERQGRPAELPYQFGNRVGVTYDQDSLPFVMRQNMLSEVCG
ncbi:MAG TPA: hypothetical protein VF586_19435 [Pyrinomonadaceae bacterium]|jgi:hypothetical protein